MAYELGYTPVGSTGHLVNKNLCGEYCIHILNFYFLGIPVWVGRKLYTRYKYANKHKRNTAIVGGVALSVSTFSVYSSLIFNKSNCILISDNQIANKCSYLLKISVIHYSKLTVL